MIGDLFTDGQLCLSMREAGVVVVDVNYRHCPGKMICPCRFLRNTTIDKRQKRCLARRSRTHGQPYNG